MSDRDRGEIAIALLRDDRLENYRRAERNIDKLEASIRQEGLRTPLLVRPFRDPSHREPTVYDVIDGRRRLRALRRIHEEDAKAFAVVPVVFYKGNDVDALVMGFHLNNEREGHGPVEVGEFLRIMTNKNLKIADAAKRAGISGPWASRVLRVRNQCPEPVLKAVDQGKLPFKLAEEWADLPGDEQEKRLAQFTAALAAAEGAKGARKKAASAAGGHKVLGWRPLTNILALVQKREGDYWKGYADALQTATAQKDVPKDLQKELDEQKKRMKAMKPKGKK